jgi:hypothetical protein
MQTGFAALAVAVTVSFDPPVVLALVEMGASLAPDNQVSQPKHPRWIYVYHVDNYVNIA